MNHYTAYNSIVSRILAPDAAAWVLSETPDGFWLAAKPVDVAALSQGWKLHVAAIPVNAEAVLEAILPILVHERAWFKLAASSRALEQLATGRFGISQISKFVTVYPSNDAQAARIGLLLSAATTQFLGPSAVFDRPVDGSAVVSYRYGDFDGRIMQLSTGEIIPALSDPTGDLTEDDRTKTAGPPWAVNPFRPTSLDVPEIVAPILAGRFVSVAHIARSARGNLLIGFDRNTFDTCVIKTARPGSLALNGSLATDQLEHEAEILNLLSASSRVPKLIHHETAGSGESILVMSDLGGRRLSTVVTEHVLRAGRPLNTQDTVRVGLGLADCLRDLSDRSLVFRDLSPSNVLVRSSYDIVLADFEFCSKSGSLDRSPGTPGFMSPQHREGLPSHYSDDVYGLGAVLAYCVTGAFPPPPSASTMRWLTLRSLNTPKIMMELVASCMATDARARPTLQEVKSLLADIASREVNLTPSVYRARMANVSPVAASPSAVATRMADKVCDLAVRVGNDVSWYSHDPGVFGGKSFDLGLGAAGCIFALSQFADSLPTSKIVETLTDASWTLARQYALSQRRISGLWVGTSGVAIALLRAAEAIGDLKLESYAHDLFLEVPDKGQANPDIYSGNAGMCLAQILAWTKFGEVEFLNKARALADGLLSSQLPSGLWMTPGRKAGSAFYGYAHGAAGIADALLTIWQITGDSSYASALNRAVDRLISAGQTISAVNGALGWPSQEGETSSEPFWCRGATGIGKLLLRVYQATGRQDAADAAVAAGKSAAAAEWLGLCLCHGLAGSVRFLQALDEAFPDEGFRRSAVSKAFILSEEHLIAERECDLGSSIPGTRVPEYADNFSPELLTGIAGCAITLLSLEQNGRAGQSGSPLICLILGVHQQTNN